MSGWTDERKQQLQELWAEGLSASEIGRRLDATKNAVVGMAHRMKLPARQSPFTTKRSGAGELREAKARTSRTKPPAQQAEAPRQAVPPATTTAGLRLVPAAPQQAAKPCRWVIGDTRPRPARYCGAPITGTTPLTACYCAKHARRAVRSPSEPEAA